ncbi:unnamed protein product [Periconia digitata]|uniref:Uncharacterized protein n=1 Tax=Periconia digitata TaxID=1303443 RepID=A0A9W4XN73_9PLEO|nr:unnamed protein product [Periconia digitata]
MTHLPSSRPTTRPPPIPSTSQINIRPHLQQRIPTTLNPLNPRHRIKNNPPLQLPPLIPFHQPLQANLPQLNNLPPLLIPHHSRIIHNIPLARNLHKQLKPHLSHPPTNPPPQILPQILLPQLPNLLRLDPHIPTHRLKPIPHKPLPPLTIHKLNRIDAPIPLCRETQRKQFLSAHEALRSAVGIEVCRQPRRVATRRRLQEREELFARARREQRRAVRYYVGVLPFSFRGRWQVEPHCYAPRIRGR